jgi:hypothetical protein
MGNLRACFAVALLALAACGSDHAKVDASIVIIDSPTPDAKVWMDAPPGPNYDLTCLGSAAPTTAADPITVAGQTATLTMSGTSPVPMVDVAVFKTGTANALASVTSDGGGVFTTGNIATGGVPIDGYVRGMEPTYRSSYIYPPSVVDMSLTGVPVLLVSNQAFGFLANLAGVTQDDDNNGVLLVQVGDCTTPMTQPIDGATVQVQQNGTDVGTIFDLGALAAQAAGTFFVFNVPDGATQVLVSFNSMNFPTHTVAVHKKPTMGANPEATVTVLAARPGL